MAENINDRIRREVAAWPLLTPEQRACLTLLLHPTPQYPSGIRDQMHKAAA